jgi:uncharacterized protein (TIGR02001 family)
LWIKCRFQRRRRGFVEIDWYGGLPKNFGGVDASIGLISYSYFGASGSLNYNFIKGNLALGYNASLDNFGDSGAAHYFSGSLSYAVPTAGVGLILDASVGRQLIEDNAAFGTPDYWDWRIGASLALTPNISISAFYTDTDISTADYGSENCDARGQVSLAASFLGARNRLPPEGAAGRKPDSGWAAPIFPVIPVKIWTKPEAGRLESKGSAG